jgi:hypothetical protein
MNLLVASCFNWRIADAQANTVEKLCSSFVQFVSSGAVKERAPLELIEIFFLNQWRPVHASLGHLEITLVPPLVFNRITHSKQLFVAGINTRRALGTI